MERDFKGIWIPKEIWLYSDLTMQEKIFLVEIDSLDNNGECYAKNEHFANFFNLSKNRCSEIIKSLETKGYIVITYIKDGKQIIKRVIQVTNKGFMRDNDNIPLRDTEDPLRGIEDFPQDSEDFSQEINDPPRNIEDPLPDTEDPLRDIDNPPSENCEENNTVYNNTINNIYNDSQKPDETPKETNSLSQSVVDKYNELCVSLPKVLKLTDKRKKAIKKLYESKVIDKDIERFNDIFQMAEASDFLTGRDGTWYSCNFDWLLKSDNPVKILEGTYANRAKPKSKQEKPVSGFINYDQTNRKQYEVYQQKLDLRTLYDAGKITKDEYQRQLKEIELQGG